MSLNLAVVLAVVVALFGAIHALPDCYPSHASNSHVAKVTSRKAQDDGVCCQLTAYKQLCSKSGGEGAVSVDVEVENYGTAASLAESSSSSLLSQNRLFTQSYLPHKITRVRGAPVSREEHAALLQAVTEEHEARKRNALVIKMDVGADPFHSQVLLNKSVDTVHIEYPKINNQQLKSWYFLNSRESNDFVRIESFKYPAVDTNYDDRCDSKQIIANVGPQVKFDTATECRQLCYEPYQFHIEYCTPMLFCAQQVGDSGNFYYGVISQDGTRTVDLKFLRWGDREEPMNIFVANACDPTQFGTGFSAIGNVKVMPNTERDPVTLQVALLDVVWIIDKGSGPKEPVIWVPGEKDE